MKSLISHVSNVLWGGYALWTKKNGPSLTAVEIKPTLYSLTNDLPSPILNSICTTIYRNTSTYSIFHPFSNSASTCLLNILSLCTRFKLLCPVSYALHRNILSILTLKPYTQTRTNSLPATLNHHRQQWMACKSYGELRLSPTLIN